MPIIQNYFATKRNSFLTLKVFLCIVLEKKNPEKDIVQSGVKSHIKLRQKRNDSYNNSNLKQSKITIKE